MNAKTILHLSDWHCNEVRFEETLCRVMDGRSEPDILVITGDMIYDPPFFINNERAAAEEQRQVWESFVYSIHRVIPGVGDIVAVPGNHDWCDYAIPSVVHSFDKAEGSVIEVDGLRIGGWRGVPRVGNPRITWSHELDPFAFNWLMAEVDKIQPEIDMLVVHSPPYGVLDQVRERRKHDQIFDKSVGVPGLKEWCDAKPSLRLVCFGHIHEQGGMLTMGEGKEAHVTYSNASCHANWLNVIFGD